MHNAKIPVTTYRKDYKAPLFEIENVYLNVKIIAEDDVIVTNTMHLKRTKAEDSTTLQLDGEALVLLSIQLDGKTLSEQDYAVDNESLIIHHVPDTFELIITSKCDPKANTLLSGLYFADNLFCTQCESNGFRRITYYMDRPDVLSLFTVRIEADRKKYPVLLSNGNCIAQDEHSVTWEDPFKKPSYLFALVAGDLACVEDYFITMSGRKVLLQIYVDHGNENQCKQAMQSLKNSMKWDEDTFGCEYDLDIYMIVAVRSFNMGAMENKGLNVFNSKYVLGLPENATDADYAGIERVIGHEYFHNWTGNRVTCRDWFQLSLKEGLTVFRDQSFSQDMQKSRVCRIQDVKTLRGRQFSEDASPLAHPVRPESYIEINNFYTVTIYEKGAEVIRMQQTLLGKEGFRKGMDLYFKRHDGQAVTIDDFVKAMEDANGKDLTQFKRWYSQAGTPEITAHSDYDAVKQQFSLTLSQSCPATPDQPTKEPFHIPVAIALWEKSGKSIAIPEHILELKESKQTWTWQNISSQPIVSLLGDFSAPVKLHIDYTDSELQCLIQAETNDFSRWEALQRINHKYLSQKIHDKASTLPSFFIDIYESIFNNTTIDLLSKSELFTLPSFLEFTQTLTSIDVDATESAREIMYETVGKSLSEHFFSTYKTLNQKSTSDMTAQAFSERKFKNTALGYLIHAKHPEAKTLAFEQLMHAKSMTDELAALYGLMYFDEETRDKASQHFYQKWKHNSLVLDKWLSAQAMSTLPDTLDQVKKLFSHPSFDQKNPNQIKALLGTFWMYNPRAFHAIDGRGYDFFVEKILMIDKDNAFTSAALVRSMINWRHFDKTRQHLMQNALKTILKEKNLSKDLYEVVSKSTGE